MYTSILQFFRYFDVLDTQGIPLKHYISAPAIMKFLNKTNIPMTGVSSNDVENVQSLINLFKWDKYLEKLPVVTGRRFKRLNKLNQLNKYVIKKKNNNVIE